MVSDLRRRRHVGVVGRLLRFQSALRFAVVSDVYTKGGPFRGYVSIRFEVRGGFRPLQRRWKPSKLRLFQSALRFAVVSDKGMRRSSDLLPIVSIRFEVRGGFRPL